MDNGLSASDVALLDNNKSSDVWNGGGAFFWIFALLILAGGGFGGWGGNGANANAGLVTQAELTNQLNAQTQNQQLQQIALSSANNNYETAQLINSQTQAMLEQNNTNLINAIQGFNSVTQAINAQGSQLQGQLAQLGYHTDTCCCDIKTQMLQDRLRDAQTALNAANNQISNAQQSQYLLGQLGRFVAYTGEGSSASSST